MGSTHERRPVRIAAGRLLRLPAAAAAGAAGGGAGGASYGVLFGAAWAVVTHGEPGVALTAAGGFLAAGAVAGGLVGVFRAVLDPEPLRWGFPFRDGRTREDRGRSASVRPVSPSRSIPVRPTAFRGWGRGFRGR